MMDRKPWENRDSHREGFGGRREWNSDRSDRRFGEDRPRFNREDRFGNDRPRFNREDRFGDDRPRFNRENRFEAASAVTVRASTATTVRVSVTVRVSTATTVTARRPVPAPALSVKAASRIAKTTASVRS